MILRMPMLKWFSVYDRTHRFHNATLVHRGSTTRCHIWWRHIRAVFICESTVHFGCVLMIFECKICYWVLHVRVKEKVNFLLMLFFFNKKSFQSNQIALTGSQLSAHHQTWRHDIWNHERRNFCIKTCFTDIKSPSFCRQIDGDKNISLKLKFP